MEYLEKKIKEVSDFGNSIAQQFFQFKAEIEAKLSIHKHTQTEDLISKHEREFKSQIDYLNNWCSLLDKAVKDLRSKLTDVNVEKPKKRWFF